MRKWMSVILVFVCLFSFGLCEGEKPDSEEAQATEAYDDLRVGSRGDAVKALQERLMQMGFLLDDRADGIYGKRTAGAVHDFKAANGIEDAESHKPEKCAATAEMQVWLFSDEAKPYAEPEFPLVILAEAGINKKEKGDSLTFAPTVLNESRSRDILSFTLKCSAEDIWGNPVFDESVQTEWTTKKTIEPGEQARADALTLPNRARIANLSISITSVTFAESGTMEIEEPACVTLAPVEW